MFLSLTELTEVKNDKYSFLLIVKEDKFSQTFSFSLNKTENEFTIRIYFTSKNTFNISFECFTYSENERITISQTCHDIASLFMKKHDYRFKFATKQLFIVFEEPIIRNLSSYKKRLHNNFIIENAEYLLNHSLVNENRKYFEAIYIPFYISKLILYGEDITHLCTMLENHDLFLAKEIKGTNISTYSISPNFNNPIMLFKNDSDKSKFLYFFCNVLKKLGYNCIVEYFY